MKMRPLILSLLLLNLAALPLRAQWSGSADLSADGEECWVDVARGNRRLFLLGIRWHF